MLVEYLERSGFTVRLIREPGGTRLGEVIRGVLLDPGTGSISGEAEALLYAASRAELVRTVIEPALASGEIVVADRFMDSSIAYQGGARGLGIEEVEAANRLAVGGASPDLTLFFDVPAEVAAARRAAESGEDDRIEQEGSPFFESVASCYRELALRFPERIHTVNADADPEVIFSQVKSIFEAEVSK